MLTTQEIIDYLKLTPHPTEGGYFKIVHQDKIKIPNSILPEFVEVDEERTICDAIYYLIDRENCSQLHKIAGNMLYHFHYGDPVEILLLHPEGHTPRTERVTFGNNLKTGQQPIKLIPGGSWFSAFVPPPGNVALMGVSLSPGFNTHDYTLGQRDELIQQYTTEKDLITALTLA